MGDAGPRPEDAKLRGGHARSTGRVRAPLRDEAPQGGGQLPPEPDLDDPPVGLQLGGLADHVADRVRDRKSQLEHPGDDGEHHAQTARPTNVSTGRALGEGVGRGPGDGLQQEADPGEDDDRQREPLADGQRDGVQTEVMAELVGEHAGQLAVGRTSIGEAGDDDEMTAAGERVDLVGVEHGEDESPLAAPVRPG